MQKVLLPKQAGILTVALLIACPLLNSSTGAMSVRQGISKTQPASGVPGSTRQSNQSKPTVMARNTTHEVPARTEKGENGTTAKSKQPEGKTTVGRCWKRLMGNLREIRHAQKKN